MVEQRPTGEERASGGRRVTNVEGDEPGRTYFTALGRWPGQAGITRAELAERLDCAQSTLSQLLGNRGRGPDAGTPKALEWAKRVIRASGGTEADVRNWTTFHHEISKYQDGVVVELPPPPEPGREYLRPSSHPARAEVQRQSPDRLADEVGQTRSTDIVLDELADRLADAMDAQWVAAAMDRGLLIKPLPIRWRRCADPVAGPVTAAIAPASGGRWPRRLPGLLPVTENQLLRGTSQMLHDIYGGLASGRLIIAGGPGTGKSSAAILLLLDALKYRRDIASNSDRAQVPVPVLFTLQDWDPANTPVQQWLATKLGELPILAGRHNHHHAVQLLRKERIAVMLDGLDEIPANRRPIALRALAEQANFRLVLLTRTTELAAATHHRVLTGAAAIELQPLTENDADTYLRNSLPHPPPAPWRRLFTTLAGEPTAPITQALDNPLTITLLRDSYQNEPLYDSSTASPDELLDTNQFPSADSVDNHLLDHAVPNAYAPRPGHTTPRYDSRAAMRILTVIAEHLNERGDYDLRWWGISDWIPRVPRILIMSGLNAAIVGLAMGFAFGSLFGSKAGLVLGPAFGLMIALGSGYLAVSPDNGTPIRIVRLRGHMAPWRRVLAVGFVSALIFGPIAGLGISLMFGPVLGVAVTLAAGLMFGMVFGFESDDPTKVAHPGDLWRSELVHWLALYLGPGATTGIVFGLVSSLEFGLTIGLTITLLGVLLFSHAWRTTVSQLYMAVRFHTPLRLGRFLEDARQRRLLRTVGSSYQFRHATLQDRLAAPRSPGKDPNR